MHLLRRVRGDLPDRRDHPAASARLQVLRTTVIGTVPPDREETAGASWLAHDRVVRRGGASGRVRIEGMTHRRGVVAALLVGSALASPAVANAAPSGLHDCKTSVNRNVGNGSCHGTGTFRVDVTCADGSTVKSPPLQIHGGFGTLGVSCRSAATSAKIVELPTSGS
jgi:hypothetical protein